jgi:glucose-6-phosphate isomerase
MNPTIKPLTERQAWNALAAHHQSARELHLRKLFADDPERGERMTAKERVCIWITRRTASPTKR